MRGKAWGSVCHPTREALESLPEEVSASASQSDRPPPSRRLCLQQCGCRFQGGTSRSRKTSSPAASTRRLSRRSPGTYYAVRLRDLSPESAPRRPWPPSRRWPEWEWCFFAQRSPEKVAVLAEDRSCGRQVPWLC